MAVWALRDLLDYGILYDDSKLYNQTNFLIVTLRFCVSQYIVWRNERPSYTFNVKRYSLITASTRAKVLHTPSVIYYHS